MREDGAKNVDRNFGQRQKSDRLEDGNDVSHFRLRRPLVGQMAIGTSRIVRGVVAIKVADDNGGERQQRERSERDCQDTDCLADIHFLEAKPPR